MCEYGIASAKTDWHMRIGSAEDHLYDSEAEGLRKFVQGQTFPTFPVISGILEPTLQWSVLIRITLPWTLINTQ